MSSVGSKHKARISRSGGDEEPRGRSQVSKGKVEQDERKGKQNAELGAP